MARLLEVTDLSTHFQTEEGLVRAVDRVSFSVDEGETLGLVGESGCGKSVAALSLVRLVPPPGRIVSGRIVYKGTDLMALRERDMRRYRGREIALVFQEPMSALNPVYTVGYQIAEGLIVHKMMRKREALLEAARLMDLVRIPGAADRLRDYPHQMSGGMRQRVMIAMALACRPSLVVADEPTTALDVTIQAEILDLLKGLKKEFGLSLILISHNLGVIAEAADRVAVMYAGRIVEQAPVRDLFASPRHPYTEGLLRSIPRLGGGGEGPAGRKRRLAAIEGSVPNLAALPTGCAFHPRCPDVMPECRAREPRLLPLGAGRAQGGAARAVSCFKHHDAGGTPR
ncbi:MAG: dipeptide ABC transporter ATP-binding protein DppD [Acidobacteria bacterium]|nr:MAG: dipeptide ABC transporter ATP-binding protein DppD [Acidobacteriota bacterium]